LLVLPTGGFFEFKTYALAGRLRASWMDARVTKVARISARFSEFLARRRFCQNQEKVRSLDHPAARQDDEAPFPARRNRESRYGRNATHFWVTLLAQLRRFDPPFRDFRRASD
jgi:hypothetical protein